MAIAVPDYSLLPYFLAWFIGIYLTAYFVVFRNWNPRYHPDACSCFMSLFHGTPAVILAVASICDTPIRGYDSQNTNFQNHVLEFSIAYFIVDLLHYLILIPSEILFIAHHLATLFVFLTCRYLAGHGAFALLILLVCAEVTSAFQNVWTLAGMRRGDLPSAANLYKKLSLPFYIFYTAMRGVIGPGYVYMMSAYYLSGKAKDVIPMWVSNSWIVVISTAIVVSIMWVSNLWKELFREKKNVENDEKKNG